MSQFSNIHASACSNSVQVYIVESHQVCKVCQVESIQVAVSPVLVDPDVTIEIVCVIGSMTICDSAKIVPSAKYKVPSTTIIPSFLLFIFALDLGIKYDKNCYRVEYI